MKLNIYFFLAALFIALNLSAQDEQIPNSNFEQWDNTHYATGWNSYEIDVFISTYYTAEQTTDAAFGDYAVKLETQDLVLETLPGVILLGEVDFETFMPYGGIPFTSRPTGMRFSYKYSPQGDDTGVAVALLTKWNETTETADTVGGGFFYIEEPQTEYFRKTFPIYYQSAEQPDTINVGFVSSFESPVPGSVMFVDSVEMVYDLVNYPTICLPAGNINANQFTASWVPIPHAIYYSLEVASDENFNTILPDYPVQITNSYQPSYVVEVPAARYFYRVKVLYAADESEYSNVITVPMPTQASPADNISSDGFRANWLPADGVSEYLLDVAEDAQFSNILGSYNGLSVGTATNYEVTDLNDGTEYFYRLRVVYDSDTSQVSNTMSVITDPLSRLTLTPDMVRVSNAAGGVLLSLKPEILPADVRVYDLSGRTIMSKRMHTSELNIPLPNNGLFILHLSSDKGVLNKKIISGF